MKEDARRSSWALGQRRRTAAKPGEDVLHLEAFLFNNRSVS
jgi:hypothetical protein